jgi:hypothetical protein
MAAAVAHVRLPGVHTRGRSRPSDGKRAELSPRNSSLRGGCAQCAAGVYVCGGAATVPLPSRRPSGTAQRLSTLRALDSAYQRLEGEQSRCAAASSIASDNSTGGKRGWDSALPRHAPRHGRAACAVRGARPRSGGRGVSRSGSTASRAGRNQTEVERAPSPAAGQARWVSVHGHRRRGRGACGREGCRGPAHATLFAAARRCSGGRARSARFRRSAVPAGAARAVSLLGSGGDGTSKPSGYHGVRALCAVGNATRCAPAHA